MRKLSNIKSFQVKKFCNNYKALAPLLRIAVETSLSGTHISVIKVVIIIGHLVYDAVWCKLNYTVTNRANKLMVM